MVNCETQEEIDYYWEKVQCGWLTDKYGLSWQVVPVKISEWVWGALGFQRVMYALMPMNKLDIATLGARL